MIMLFNYIKMAVRAQLKNFTLSLVNIAGLALGLACVFFIALYIRNELSYDRHFQNAANIYRIPTTLGDYQTPSSPIPLIDALDRYPEVIAATRLFKSDAIPFISANDIDSFQEKDSYYADSTVFKVFSFEFLQGDEQTALRDVNAVVISESAARKYFGDTKVLGRMIRRDNNQYFKITGIFRDLPSTTHFDAHFLFSSLANPLLNDYSSSNWDWLYSNYTYVVLSEQADIAKMNRSLANLFWDVTENTREAYGADYILYLQSLLDIHLHSHLEGELKTNANISTLIALGGIGIITLLIASINFMNLATAGSINRAKEVGMRKVMGVTRRMLRIQFLTESVLICFVSGVVAFAILFGFLELFRDITDISIQWTDLLEPQLIGGLFLIVLVVGILSGIYPAFFLTSFEPVSVLKGKFADSLGAVRVRKILVIAQFAIGCTVLAVTLVIGQQLSFMLEKDLGFTKDNILIITMPNDTIGVEEVKNELLTVSGVSSVSKISDPFANITGWLIWNFEGATNGETLPTTRFHADEDFIKVMDIKMVAGRYYSLEHKADSDKLVINETAARKMGWTAEQAIGKRMGQPERPRFVMGVVKDFHFRHLSSPITPFVMYKRKVFSFEKAAMVVRIDGTAAETIGRIEEKWNTLVPHWPLQFQFLNESLNQQYDFEKRLGRLTSIFSTLAIIIAVVGLMGLAVYSVRQKEKQIGIRKVLGATPRQLVELNTIEFGKLVVVGGMVALPVTWYATEQWLNIYAYRVEFSVLPLTLALMISLVLAILTVSAIAWRASVADPVKTLRNE